MGLKREDALKLILEERDFQDQQFNPDEERAPGITRGQEHLFSPPHIAQLIAYSLQANNEWVWDYKMSGSQLQQYLANRRSIVKIAAIALRAMEEIYDMELLLTEGLR